MVVLVTALTWLAAAAIAGLPALDEGPGPSGSATVAWSESAPRTVDAPFAWDDERERIRSCAGSSDAETAAHVTQVLRRRQERLPDDPGFRRFMVVGASASRNMYFLTGFGRGQHSWTAPYAFLQRVVDYFDARGKRSSFVRKGATASGTSPQSYVWESKVCPDCQERLETEILAHRPAFAVVMFGTNNASWRGVRGGRRTFYRRVAAGLVDDQCPPGRCLPPWDFGPIEYHGAEARVGGEVARVMRGKLHRFESAYRQLIRRLLDRDIVVLLTTAPPIPRLWLEEDTIYRLNEVVRRLGSEFRIPVIDLWCALSPSATGDDGEPHLDWTHPLMLHHKGMGKDRYHPDHLHAFEIADEHLIRGYNVRNLVTLYRLYEMMELAEWVESSAR